MIIRIRLAFIVVLMLVSLQIFAGSEFDKVYDSAHHYMSISSDKAIYFSKEAIHIAETNRDMQQLAKAYWMMGYLYQLDQEPGNAIRYYYGALNVYKRLDDYKSVVKLYENIGTITRQKGLDKMAIRAFEQRLDFAKELDYQEECEAYFDLGIAYRSANQLDLSAKSFLEAWKLVRLNHPTADDFDLASRIFNELGITYQRAARAFKDPAFLDSATKSYLTALDFAEAPINKFYPTNNIGEILIRKNEYDSSLFWLGKAMEIGEVTGSKLLLIPTYNNLGIVYIKKQDQVMADSMFRTALRYNIRDYTVNEIIHDQKLYVNVLNDDEMEVSLSYLDTLKKFTDADKYALVDRIRIKYLERAEVESNATKSIVSIEIAQIEAEMQAEERREKLLKYAQFGGIVLVLGLVIFYLGLRVHQFKKGVKNVMEGIRRANKKFGNII